MLATHHLLGSRHNLFPCDAEERLDADAHDSANGVLRKLLSARVRNDQREPPNGRAQGLFVGNAR